VAVLVLLAGGLTLALLVGDSRAWPLAVMATLSDGGLAALVLVAAGGLAWPIVRLLAPAEAPLGLRLVTAGGVGLWLLATLVLIIGSLGGLSAALWWPVVGVGAVLAGWQGRHGLRAWEPGGKTDIRGLMWVLLAIAAGLVLAGLTLPPGLVATGESYDVLEYHLQVPREYYDAGRVHELEHNCYSYYPGQMHMLALLAMVLRGGPYAGAYAAKFLHAAFLAGAVAAVFLALLREDEVHGRFAAVLLASAPLAIQLAWQAVDEPAMLFYLALGLLWLRHWLARPGWGAAACVGLALGGACAVKYLSVGFIAAPVGAAMLALSVRSGRRLAQAGLAAALVVAGMAPWLIRNTAYTGNPVFPLAASVFGRAHWTEESQRRWQAGHGPDTRPPVPEPAGYEAPDRRPSRAALFWGHFVTNQRLGVLLKLAAALAVCALVAHRGPADVWGWTLAWVWGAQLVLWAAVTHELPGRFLAVSIVPMALLAGGALARLARVRTNPLRRGSPASPAGPWGLPVAGSLFLIIVGINLYVGVAGYLALARLPGPEGQTVPLAAHGYPAERLGREHPRWQPAWNLPAEARLLLVGEAQGYYLPAKTRYATTFDVHPLAGLLREEADPAAVVRRLRAEYGVTHIWVSWPEVVRLAYTYGYPPELTSDLPQRIRRGAPRGEQPRTWIELLQAAQRGAYTDADIGSDLFDRLPLGPHKHYPPSGPAPAEDVSAHGGAGKEAAPAPAAAARRAWPVFTIYALRGEAAPPPIQRPDSKNTEAD